MTKTAEEMETCDFRFYSVEKVEVEQEAEEEEEEGSEESAARRLDGHAPEEDERVCTFACENEENKEEDKTEEVITAAPSGPTAEY